MLHFLQVLWRELKVTDVVKFKFWKSGDLAWFEVIFVVSGAKVNLKFSYDGESFAFYDGSVAPLDWDSMLRAFANSMSREHEPVSDSGLNTVGKELSREAVTDEVVQTVAETPVLQSTQFKAPTSEGVESTVERYYRRED